MTVCTGDLLTGQGCAAHCEYCRELRRRTKAAWRASQRPPIDPEPKPDEVWKESAACRGKPLEWFFPSSHPRKEVIELCASCPVRSECDVYARGEQHGFWAGVNHGANRHREVRTG